MKASRYVPSTCPLPSGSSSNTRSPSLIAPPGRDGVLEASGVAAKGRDLFVIFDNIRRVARLDRDLEPGSGKHAWLGAARQGEGYEDIAYSPRRRRFYLLIEAEKHPDGTYKALIDECDEAGRFNAGAGWTSRSRSATPASKG